MARIYLFLIYIHFNLLRADISTPILDKALLSYSEEGYIYPYPEECSIILKTFAQYASTFTMCSILHARPISLCENCIHEHTLFENKFQELLKTKVNGTSCRSAFISHDRLDVVLHYYDSIHAVWIKGHCDSCFDDSKHLSNDTKRFNTMYNETMECITSNMNQNNSNLALVCEKCMQSYVELDEFYKTLSTDAIGVDSVCMDIVDSMNATRFIWSKTLNCCQYRQKPEVIFLCCTAIISILPILFYVAIRYCGPIRDLPNVLKQSRFKQTILHSINRRNNRES